LGTPILDPQPPAAQLEKHPWQAAQFAGVQAGQQGFLVNQCRPGVLTGRLLVSLNQMRWCLSSRASIRDWGMQRDESLSDNSRSKETFSAPIKQTCSSVRNGSKRVTRAPRAIIAEPPCADGAAANHAMVLCHNSTPGIFIADPYDPSHGLAARWRRKAEAGWSRRARHKHETDRQVGDSIRVPCRGVVTRYAGRCACLNVDVNRVAAADL